MRLSQARLREESKPGEEYGKRTRGWAHERNRGNSRWTLLPGLRVEREQCLGVTAVGEIWVFVDFEW